MNPSRVLDGLSLNVNQRDSCRPRLVPKRGERHHRTDNAETGLTAPNQQNGARYTDSTDRQVSLSVKRYVMQRGFILQQKSQHAVITELRP